MIYFYTQERMNYRINNSINLIFDKIFVHFSKTSTYKHFKFCLLSPYIHVEGTVSQIFNLCLSFNFMLKNGKHFLKMLGIILKSYKT